MKKYDFLFFTFYFLFFAFSIAPAIEVGGHLTEDTTWSPVNNPYLVTGNIYVDEGVTLTILPGTLIKVLGASLNNYYELDLNFWLYGGDSIAKFFWVDGRIIAEGTEQDSIVFTRLQDDLDFCWGTIYITEDAELCRFKYCKIEHSCLIGIALSYITKGLDFYNGKGSVRNCKFLNCAVSINSDSYIKELEIINNEFIIDNNVNPFLPVCNYGRNHIMSSRNNNVDSPDLLICDNIFEGYGAYYCISIEQLSFVNNTISNCVSSGGIGYFVNNEFNNCNYAINGYNGDSLFIKNNRFIGGSRGVDIDYAYVEITDNYFEECALDGPSSPYYTSGKVENNIINGVNTGIRGRFETVRNNIIMNSRVGKSVIGSSDFFQNNIFYGCEHLCSGISDNSIHENNIYLANDEIFQHTQSVYGNPIFRNCIFDFELPEGCIDGGGNIWVDSLQVQSLFESIQNGDFHLIEGSLAIDAGFNTPYYHPYDMDYNIRVWDGNGNGQARIDIGPYEYGAPSLGSIEGYTYDPVTGDPVDYVLIKINNQPGEFTFSDSMGNFQYKLLAGTYDVFAERVFYEDVIEYQVEVFDGQSTQVLIPMTATVDAYDNVIPKSEFLISNLTNFPNPFNPETTISFNLTAEDVGLRSTSPGQAENAETCPPWRIIIYNIKGQKVKQLVSDIRQLPEGQHSVIWNGTDSNNKLVSSGIYFYKISSGKESVMKKMLLLK
jgi:hypothetical protein